MRRWLFLLATLAALGPGAAAAAPAGTAAEAAPGAPRHIDCRCRANGRTYELGAKICLPTPKGHRVAECRMEQNVTSWKFAPEDCSVTAGLHPAGADAAQPTAR